MQNNVSLKFDSLDIYNLAIYNNSIPLIDEVIVTNNSDFSLKNVEVEISSCPSFFSPFIKKIGNISSGRFVVFNPHDLEIDLTKVMYSSQALNSVITFKVNSLTETVFETSKSITLLPYDFLPPLNIYTELISSFVTPSQEEIKSVLPLVFEHIKNEHKIPVNQDMWNYNDKNTTSAIINAIYYAVCDLKITFNTAILNDNIAEKIKLPESVLLYKNATGIEIALLVASISEKLGINTFVTVLSEKVLVGFFYTDDTFNTSVSDDARAFNNCIDGKSDNFVLIDTTSMINGISVPFETSSMTAQKALDLCETPIVIDITRSRKNGYLPMPSRIKQNGNLIFENHLSSPTFPENDFTLFKDIDTFTNKIKNNVVNKVNNRTLTSIDLGSTAFFIGNTKLIMGKLLFNQSASIKSFPISNATDNEFDFLDKLSKLNSNIDSSDVSSVINAFHDKSTLANVISSIKEQIKDGVCNAYVVHGIIRYTFNHEIFCAPLFISPIHLYDFSIKLISSKLIINPLLTDIFSKLDIKFDFDKYASDPTDSYDELFSELSVLFNDYIDISLFDISCLAVFSVENEEISRLLTADYFKRSKTLKSVFENQKIPSTTQSENLSQLDLPCFLNDCQQKALRAALSNNITVVRGANCSGKTLVSSCIAFKSLQKGEKVLYLSDSKSNTDDFISMAKKFGFEDNTVVISEPQHNTNSFRIKSSVENIKTALNESKEKLSEKVKNNTDYYESVHSVKEIGFSLFEVISQYERYRTFPYSVTFTNEEISKLKRDNVVKWFDLVSSLSKAGADCKEPHANPLGYIRKCNFSYDFKSQAASLLNQHISLSQDFINMQNSLAQYLGVETAIMREQQTQTLIKMLELIEKNGKFIHYGIFLNKNIYQAFSAIENMVLQCENIFEIKSYLKNEFTDDIVLLDPEALLSEWRAANSKFAFTKSSALSLVKNKLKAYAKNPKLVTNENFVELVSKILKFKGATELIEENSNLVYEITGIDIKTSLELGHSDIFETIKKFIETSKQYLILISEIYDGEEEPNIIYNHSYALFKNPERLKSEIASMFSSFVTLHNSYKDSERTLSDVLELDILLAKEQNNKLWYYFVSQFFERILENIDLLKYWCNWNVEKSKAINSGLQNVVKLYENEPISSSDIKNAFLKGFFKSVSEYFLSSDTRVNNFSSEKFESELEEISDMISIHQKLLKEDLSYTVSENACDYIKNVLNMPIQDAENKLKATYSFDFTDGKHLPLLQSVKPCFICDSPYKLTKFIGAKPYFDLVIVDSESYNSYYEYFLLLGMTDRLTVFENKCSEFGKILCSIGAPIVNLEWLYNTNYCFELVNELFYKNSLSFSPSVNELKKGINIVKQLGNYDRKKTRVNVIEASAVVDEIVKYVSTGSDLSVGVYTMTEEQKNLTELLLQKRIGEQIANIKSSANLFIRSFSSATYEVRDVIIFSTVFSEEEHSKYKEPITKTIPELSSSDSEEKLIDILTSAKSEFSLITSLSEEMLDNFKTTEKNYCVFKKTLRRFFDNSSAKIQEINTSVYAENSIIRQVKHHIQSLGYKVELGVGCNNSKIDIAVKSKENDKYLLGIVFDQTAYINSENFFGRNLILSDLKNRANWKIHRIYTVEWFENQNKQLDIISQLLSGDKFENQFTIHP